ncbi:MAG: hypothetical protein ABJ308_15290 [Halieaceae bacterium]
MSAQPWLDNKQWSASGISSGSKHARWLFAGFTLLWNLLTLPMFFQYEKIWRDLQRDPEMSFIFIFLVVGVLLIVMSVRSFLQWRRFGPSPLILDPYPGSSGGQVGGIIDTRIPFQAGQRFDVTLSCLYSYVSGSGKNRSRSEKIKWQSDGVCHMARSGLGTELTFRFDVPGGLPSSDHPRGSAYHVWRVSISCELDGPDFSRRYEIPVYNTAVSSSLSEGTESHAATVDAAMEGVESIADITPIAGGIDAFFPAFQRPGQGFAMILFGLVFAGAGYFVGSNDAPIIFPLIFIPVGSLIACGGVYYLGKSLRVSVTADGVRTRRFLFGYPLTSKQLGRQAMARFEIDQSATMTTGNKTTVYYRLYANGTAGQRFPVAERLSSRAEIELLKDTFETYLSV